MLLSFAVTNWTFEMFHFPMFPAEVPRPFNTQFKCYSVSMLPGPERADADRGGKIFLPPSALDKLTRLNITYPMLFKLTNSAANRATHCGVLEFIAEEGKAHIPYWMMRNLCLEEGDMIQVEAVNLPIATYAKFQAQSPAFLDITNPKAVLENILRNFACLTEGDVFGFEYNNKVYEVLVVEVKPGKAVSIIECDMNVEFTPPLGYTPPEQTNNKKSEGKGFQGVPEISEDDVHQGFRAFSGPGTRLDGKVRKEAPSVAANGPHEKTASSSKKGAGPVISRRGIPDYDFKPGTLKFFRIDREALEPKKKDDKKNFLPFTGSGKQLKPKA
ncbi:unnamed protein product [Cyprideis torosa]|uniref:Ubiquitin fusion degradation protein 1 homolog n=1 Tax=Cyprideis torosa TaxID=163714 RepID=A0A7R8ZY22_9CRUS|nr:unnamed protein product [Cyprideis torosa]CAG0907946.1 unnamed protein product [Cyprideis torosa]